MTNIGGTARRGRITLLVMLAGVLFSVPATGHAATLFVTPSSGQFAVGQTFDVVIRANSQGAAINASEGVLSFNPAQLQVQAISSTGSIFNLNVQPPEYSNSAGTVRWTGVILNPGYSGSSGNLITVRFKGVVPGSTSVKYTSGAILANDGAGTNVISGMSGGTYTIGPIASPVLPTPTPSAAPSTTGPVVTSPTHPDSLVWYSVNDPVFKWKLPEGVDGVSYLIDDKPSANPGNASDGVVSEAAFTDVPEGATYFHIKFRTGGVWGPITHYPFNVDTIQPESFNIIREDAEDTMNPRPLLSFATTDSGSGVARYMMRIGDGEWFEVPASSDDHPYDIPLQSPGNKIVLIEAVDRAGNSTQMSIVLTIVPITLPVIDQYPPTVRSGEGFTVSCTADPLVTVRIDAVRISSVLGRLIYNDQPTASVEVKTDASGRCFASFATVEDGEYRLQAVATNARGALSNPSEPVYIRVGYGILARVLGFLTGLFSGNGWFVWLLRALVFWVLMMIIAAWAHDRDWRFWRIGGSLPEAEREEGAKLSELERDMADELDILAKVSRHRPLYPEEKYLKSKLTMYRKTVRVLLKDPRSRLAKKK